MDDPIFPIRGNSIPRMLGRADLMQRIWSNLTKPTPSNYSVVGPRFVGKTVIMNALAQRAEGEESPYRFVLHWHLGHIAPVSDEGFLETLCDLLRARLAASGGKFEQLRDYLGLRSFDCLKEVTDSLDSLGEPILMLWDGFDKPLRHGKLSTQLWDQMRTIFYGKRHKIVTATRVPLRELLGSQEAVTSPFWNVFTPVRVRVFNDHDRASIIKELPGHAFDESAVTELVDWSGGVPPLFLEILNQISDDIPNGQVNHENVIRAAVKATETLADEILSMWGDCPAGAKATYSRLVESHEVPIAGVARADVACLTEKGFATQSADALRLSCKMLQEHVGILGLDAGVVARLFGNWPDYRANIRAVLEHRLGHIRRCDEPLRNQVMLMIRDIPENPGNCLSTLTPFVDGVLDVIWRREFGTAKTIPQEIVEYLIRAARSSGVIRLLEERTDNSLPSSRGAQCGILELLTGCNEKVEPRAKFTKKDTYFLINSILGFRNYGQHLDGETPQDYVAVTAVMSCIELLACLERDWPR